MSSSSSASLPERAAPEVERSTSLEERVPKRGRKPEWASELAVAEGFAGQYGLTLNACTADHQVAKLCGPDVRLVIYPHKTRGTGNRHLRVRDENSKNKRRAQALMVLLDRAAGFNCTFSYAWTKNDLAHRWSCDFLRPGVREEIEAAALSGEAPPLSSAAGRAGNLATDDRNPSPQGPTS